MDTHQNKISKIVLTGGHASTQAIAVSEELRTRHPEAKFIWIGSKYVMPGSRTTTPEYKIFPEIGVEFYSLIAGKLQTKFTRYTIPLFFGIPISFLQAFWYVARIKPKVIVSFGGFSSFPVIFWGRFLRIPVILHEQTVVAGRASLVSAFFASKIALSRGESLGFFPKDKSVVTGNPIMKELLAVKPKTKLGKVRRILVLGGSRGSEFINEEVFKILPKLLTKYKVTLVTGERNFREYKDVNLDGFRVIAYADPKTVRQQLYEESDLIVSRAGASTVSEIIFVKRPAILIPLPRTFMDEQYKNANFAKDFGIARVLTEKEVENGLLLSSIDEVFSDWQKIVDKVIDKPSPDLNASQKIAEVIEKYI